MKKERNIPDLEQKGFKKNPFNVPEGYFDTLAGRIQERIKSEEAEEIPVKKLVHSTRFRLAIAAALVGLALISYTIINSVRVGGNSGYFPDVALLDEMNVFDEDLYLLDFMETATEVVDEEEAFVNQAIEYLAMADVEMDLIFE